MDCSCGCSHGNGDHDHNHHHDHHGHHHEHHHGHGITPEDWDKFQRALESIPEASVGDLMAWHEERIQNMLANGSCAVREDRPLPAVLADLSVAMNALDSRVAGLFLPGLTPTETAAKWGEGRGNGLTDDIIALYQWHNGTDDEAEELFGGHKFLPFDDVIGVWTMLREGYSGDFLPIMQNIFGCSLLADLRPDHHAGLLYETDADDFCHPIIYPGLSAYFAAVLACFREGVFTVEKGAGDEGEDVLVGKYARMDVIFKRYRLALEQDKACNACEALSAVLSTGETSSEDLDYRISLW